MSNKLLGNHKTGLVFVVSAPAGTGKTTLVQMLVKEFPCVKTSVSCTTRPPRTGEVDGRDYHFLTQEAFKKKVKERDFLEHAHVFGHDYGTSHAFVLKEVAMGKHVILVIDTQGAMQLKEKQFPAIFIFISPPNLETLRHRLMKRESENAGALEERLSRAEKEIAMLPHYDYHIINDHLDTAYEVLRSILIAEEHKVKNI